MWSTLFNKASRLPTHLAVTIVRRHGINETDLQHGALEVFQALVQADDLLRQRPAAALGQHLVHGRRLPVRGALDAQARQRRQMLHLRPDAGHFHARAARPGRGMHIYAPLHSCKRRRAALSNLTARRSHQVRTRSIGSIRSHALRAGTHGDDSLRAWVNRTPACLSAGERPDRHPRHRAGQPAVRPQVRLEAGGAAVQLQQLPHGAQVDQRPVQDLVPERVPRPHRQLRAEAGHTCCCRELDLADVMPAGQAV